jgi:hypothetical protein
MVGRSFALVVRHLREHLKTIHYADDIFAAHLSNWALDRARVTGHGVRILGESPRNNGPLVELPFYPSNCRVCGRDAELLFDIANGVPVCSEECQNDVCRRRGHGRCPNCSHRGRQPFMTTDGHGCCSIGCAFLVDEGQEPSPRPVDPEDEGRVPANTSDREQSGERDDCHTPTPLDSDDRNPLGLVTSCSRLSCTPWPPACGS